MQNVLEVSENLEDLVDANPIKGKHKICNKLHVNTLTWFFSLSQFFVLHDLSKVHPHKSMDLHQKTDLREIGPH